MRYIMTCVGYERERGERSGGRERGELNGSVFCQALLRQCGSWLGLAVGGGREGSDGGALGPCCFCLDAHTSATLRTD